MKPDLDDGPLQVGDFFQGKFKILDVIGRGAYGFVYRARNEGLGREVALKFVKKRADLTNEIIQRAKQEAKILAQLEHPNIVRVFDVDETPEGDLVLVMELLRGKPLNQLLAEDGPLTVTDGLRVLIELCDAAHCFHEQGVFHRDLKPGNIFICDNGRPKILDFGIAKVVNSVGIDTAPNMIVGTRLYMSPEQLRGLPVDARCDMYALGLIAFQFFYGKHPFWLLEPSLEREPDKRKIVYLHMSVATPRLDEIIEGFPEKLGLLVTAASAKKPQQRFSSCRELGEKAQMILRKLSADASKTGGQFEHFTPERARALVSAHDAQRPETERVAARSTLRQFGQPLPSFAQESSDSPGLKQVIPYEDLRSSASRTTKEPVSRTITELGKSIRATHPRLVSFITVFFGGVFGLLPVLVFEAFREPSAYGLLDEPSVRLAEMPEESTRVPTNTSQPRPKLAPTIIEAHEVHETEVHETEVHEANMGSPFRSTPASHRNSNRAPASSKSENLQEIAPSKSEGEDEPSHEELWLQ